MWVVAGTPLVEARFPSALPGRVACMCVALASSRHVLSRFGCCARPRAFFAGPGKFVGDGEQCPCGFPTLNGSALTLPALAAVHWPGPGS